MIHGKARGFSLIEAIAVVRHRYVLAAVSVLCLQPAIKDARNNAAYDAVLMQMRNARERAIENREEFIVCFGIATPAGAATPLGAPRCAEHPGVSVALGSSALQCDTNQHHRTAFRYSVSGAQRNTRQVLHNSGRLRHRERRHWILISVSPAVSKIKWPSCRMGPRATPTAT